MFVVFYLNSNLWTLIFSTSRSGPVICPPYNTRLHHTVFRYYTVCLQFSLVPTSPPPRPQRPPPTPLPPSPPPPVPPGLAPIRVWSDATIYPYASQGIMCQGSNLTIVTLSGGNPECLDLFSFNTQDDAEVLPAGWKQSCSVVITPPLSLV